MNQTKKTDHFQSTLFLGGENQVTRNKTTTENQGIDMALVTCLALAVQKRRSWGQFFGAREVLGNFSPRVSGELDEI